MKAKILALLFCEAGWGWRLSVKESIHFPILPYLRNRRKAISDTESTLSRSISDQPERDELTAMLRSGKHPVRKLQAGPDTARCRCRPERPNHCHDGDGRGSSVTRDRTRKRAVNNQGCQTITSPIGGGRRNERAFPIVFRGLDAPDVGQVQSCGCARAPIAAEILCTHALPLKAGTGKLRIPP